MVKKLIFIEIKKCINPKIIFAFCFFTVIFLSTFFLYSISSTDVYVNEFSINAKIDGISAKRDAQAKIEKKLTDKELRNSLKGFTGITNDKSNFDSTGNLMINDSESIKMFNKYSDLANLVIRAYSPMYSFNPDILNHLDNGSFPLFSDNELNRMGDLNYILMIMATLEEGGYFAGNTMTGEYIVKYDDSYENAETMKDKILNLFHVIETFNLDTDSMWYRKSNFFTMFVELSKVSQIPDDIVDKIQHFETEVLANKGNEENDFGKYYSVMYTGTNSRGARIKRAGLFCKYCLAT